MNIFLRQRNYYHDISRDIRYFSVRYLSQLYFIRAIKLPKVANGEWVAYFDLDEEIGRYCLAPLNIGEITLGIMDENASFCVLRKKNKFFHKWIHFWEHSDPFIPIATIKLSELKDNTEESLLVAIRDGIATRKYQLKNNCRISNEEEIEYKNLLKTIKWIREMSDS